MKGKTGEEKEEEEEKDGDEKEEDNDKEEEEEEEEEDDDNEENEEESIHDEAATTTTTTTTITTNSTSTSLPPSSSAALSAVLAEIQLIKTNLTPEAFTPICLRRLGVAYTGTEHADLSSKLEEEGGTEGGVINPLVQAMKHPRMVALLKELDGR